MPSYAKPNTAIGTRPQEHVILNTGITIENERQLAKKNDSCRTFALLIPMGFSLASCIRSFSAIN